jgi:hypothetical protein
MHIFRTMPLHSSTSFTDACMLYFIEKGHTIVQVNTLASYGERHDRVGRIYIHSTLHFFSFSRPSTTLPATSHKYSASAIVGFLYSGSCGFINRHHSLCTSLSVSCTATFLGGNSPKIERYKTQHCRNVPCADG